MLTSTKAPPHHPGEGRGPIGERSQRRTALRHSSLSTWAPAPAGVVSLSTLELTRASDAAEHGHKRNDKTLRYPRPQTAPLPEREGLGVGRPVHVATAKTQGNQPTPNPSLPGRGEEDDALLFNKGLRLGKELRLGEELRFG